MFHLQRQQLIELIREGDIDRALDYAQEYVAPKCEEKPEYLSELGQ